MAKPNPPSPGSLPTFFSGSTYSSTLANGFTPSTTPTTPITKFIETKFNGRIDVGRSGSATSAFVAKYNHR